MPQPMHNEARFTMIFARAFLDEIGTYAKQARLNKAEFIRDAARIDMRNRDKFGEDYDLVMSLLERVPADSVVSFLTDARKSL